MANLDDIQAGLAANLGTIPGVTAYANPTVAVALPAAVVDQPRELTFEGRLGGRSREVWEMLAYLFVGNAAEPGTQADLNQYVTTAGPMSVIAAITSDPTLGGVAKGLGRIRLSRFKTYTLERAEVLGFEISVEVQA